MLPRLLVFDLDGTLVDSQIDLANSINAMLLFYGKPALKLPVIANYIGDGASTLVRRALAHAHLIADEADPHDDVFIDEALAWFIAYYRIHKLDFTYVYPGVLDALASIRQSHPDILMAVLTNKPVDPSRAICAHFGLDRFFFQNYGGNSFASKKPDPEGLHALIDEASAIAGVHIAAADVIMIGDSHVDIETARTAGTRSIGCTYGLSPSSLIEAGPDLLADSPSKWPAAITQIPGSSG